MTTPAAALAAARQRVEAICLRPVLDVAGRPTWICRECAVVGAHLANCRLSAILAALAAAAAREDEAST